MRKKLLPLFLVCIVLMQLFNIKTLAVWAPPAAPTGRAVFLMNADTGTVLYSKNEREKMYPASITKVMTAIVAYEKLKSNLNQVITVQKSDLAPLSGTGASTSGLKEGEQLTIEQLLNCLLVPSGDDSALVLARAAGGDVDTFVKEMNAKAKEIGAKNTHYVNPHGLHDSEQYTTAEDTYLIARYAMEKCKDIANIVSQTSYTLPPTNKRAKATVFYNTNWTLRSSYRDYYLSSIKGIKTGSTSQAGACLVSYAQKGGITFYCVVMGGTKSGNSNSSFADTKALYDWAFGHFQIMELVKPSYSCKEVKVQMGLNKEKLMLVSKSQFNALVPKDTSQSNMKLVTHAPDTVTAPIKKGQTIGYADVMVTGANNTQQKLGTVSLVASESVQLSTPLYIMNVLGKFIHSIWFKVAIALAVILLAAYIWISYNYNRRKKQLNRRRSKRYKGLK